MDRTTGGLKSLKGTQLDRALDCEDCCEFGFETLEDFIITIPLIGQVPASIRIQRLEPVAEIGLDMHAQGRVQIVLR